MIVDSKQGDNLRNPMTNKEILAAFEANPDPLPDNLEQLRNIRNYFLLHPLFFIYGIAAKNTNFAICSYQEHVPAAICPYDGLDMPRENSEDYNNKSPTITTERKTIPPRKL
jgi:hypothetical protein